MLWTATATRADAGDQVAARRLAWMKAVADERRHVAWLFGRLRAHEAAMRRMIGEGADACQHCAKRAAQARDNYEYFVREIIERGSQSKVATWATWRRVWSPTTPNEPTGPEPTTTPEDTLREADIDDARLATYQRKFSTLLAGRPKASS